MKQSLSLAYRSLKTAVESSRWLQMALLGVTWAVCQVVVDRTGLPLPGGVLGLFVLIAALLGGWISPSWIKRGANSLIDHLALFFIPAMVAFVSHPEFFGWLGVKFIVAVLVGTLSVMVGTALVVDLAFRFVRGMNQTLPVSSVKPLGRLPVSNPQLLAVYVKQSRSAMRGASFRARGLSLESGLE
jgi:holin-like protein